MPAEAELSHEQNVSQSTLDLATLVCLSASIIVIPAYNGFDAGHCQNNYHTKKEFFSIVNLLDMFAKQ